MGELLQKAVKGFKRLGLLMRLSGVLGACNKAVAIAKQIPPVYQAERIKEWREKLDKIYQ
jgi:hypothetical protein